MLGGQDLRPSDRSRGCPRNCKRRGSSKVPLTGFTGWEGRTNRSSREPGDLPSRVARLPRGARGSAVEPVWRLTVVGVVALGLQRYMHHIGGALRRQHLRPRVIGFGRCIEREGNP